MDPGYVKSRLHVFRVSTKHNESSPRPPFLLLLKSIFFSYAWWYILMVIALRRPNEEDYKFNASLR